MRLAGAAVAESNNIVVGDDIFTTGQFENERLVERWNGSEVERVETLHCGKAGGADAALDHAPFAIDEFELGEAQKEADMIEPPSRAASDVVALTRRRALERGIFAGIHNSRGPTWRGARPTVVLKSANLRRTT